MKKLLLFIGFLIAFPATASFGAGMALDLPGNADSFFEVPDSPSLDAELGESLTLEAWIFPKKGGDEQMILNKEDCYEIGFRDNTFQVALQPAGGAWEWVEAGAGAVAANKWTHVAATYDGKELKTYVNGKFFSKFPKNGKVNDNPVSLKMGRRVRGDAVLHSAYFGLIDEVRISKTLRYKADFKVSDREFDTDSDTVALYHFNEAEGKKVKDASKSKNDGELRGGAKLVASDVPIAPLAVDRKGKLATAWGKVKYRY